MIDVSFTIPGNQEDLAGNPIGYTRTLKGKWRDDAVRYMAWQEYVKARFYDAYSPKFIPITTLADGPPPRMQARYYASKFPKPIQLKRYVARLDTAILVRGIEKTRADADNIHKGIADALFENDKFVLFGSYKMAEGPAGHVEVRVRIAEFESNFKNEQ